MYTYIYICVCVYIIDIMHIMHVMYIRKKYMHNTIADDSDVS